MELLPKFTLFYLIIEVYLILYETPLKQILKAHLNFSFFNGNYRNTYNRAHKN